MKPLADIDHLPCGSLITSPDRKVLSINQYFSEVLNWQPETLTGPTPAMKLKMTA
jgi:hypothetical protein